MYMFADIGLLKELRGDFILPSATDCVLDFRRSVIKPFHGRSQASVVHLSALHL